MNGSARHALEGAIAVIGLNSRARIRVGGGAHQATGGVGGLSNAGASAQGVGLCDQGAGQVVLESALRDGAGVGADADRGQHPAGGVQNIGEGDAQARGGGPALHRVIPVLRGDTVPVNSGIHVAAGIIGILVGAIQVRHSLGTAKAVEIAVGVLGEDDAGSHIPRERENGIACEVDHGKVGRAIGDAGKGSIGLAGGGHVGAIVASGAVGVVEGLQRSVGADDRLETERVRAVGVIAIGGKEAAGIERIPNIRGGGLHIDAEVGGGESGVVISDVVGAVVFINRSRDVRVQGVFTARVRHEGGIVGVIGPPGVGGRLFAVGGHVAPGGVNLRVAPQTVINKPLPGAVRIDDLLERLAEAIGIGIWIIDIGGGFGRSASARGFLSQRLAPVKRLVSALEPLLVRATRPAHCGGDRPGVPAGLVGDHHHRRVVLSNSTGIPQLPASGGRRVNIVVGFDAAASRFRDPDAIIGIGAGIRILDFPTHKRAAGDLVDSVDQGAHLSRKVEAHFVCEGVEGHNIRQGLRRVHLANLAGNGDNLHVRAGGGVGQSGRRE
ncbi:MAG: hypothetical protein BWX68_02890 [Verrucomicrobia bacterium ADurb.Bin063]|nr:MAG: hypothetical protein BWX68_02890 [Verrucomicrobia bacterium ADurb.Bin063]